jgi:hypothetical protein
MLHQEALRFGVAFVDDTLHFDVDEARGLIAERLLAANPVTPPR